MNYEPNDEQPPDFNVTKPLNEKWIYFALGYTSATIAWFIIWVVTKIE